MKPLYGHPLLAYSVVAALNSSKISRVFVSTDSHEYAKIAMAYGGEAPFLRPPEISQDHSRDVDFLLHALTWWQQNHIAPPDFLVFLRPTTPLRDPLLIDQAIEKIMVNHHATSLCSGFELPESPVKNFKLYEDGTFHGFMGDAYLALPRQECPKAYVWDGYVDILRPKQIIDNPEDIYGPARLAMLTPPGVEIDTLEEFEFIEFLLKKKDHVLLPLLEKAKNQYEQ